MGRRMMRVKKKIDDRAFTLQQKRRMIGRKFRDCIALAYRSFEEINVYHNDADAVLLKLEYLAPLITELNNELQDINNSLAEVEIVKQMIAWAFEELIGGEEEDETRN